MEFFVWQRTCVDDKGNILASASVTVTDAISGSLATLYSDEGSTTIGNPVTADSDGFVQFYVKAGFYTIKATKGDSSRTWTKEPIGAPHNKTPAETTAGVTPVNLRYDFDVIDRFATNTTPGTTDMSTAFSNADTVGLTHVRVRNGVHRISSDTTIDAVLIFEGTGQISVDSGVTFTCGGVVAHPSVTCFKGSGTVVLVNQTWSLGWFDGTDASSKWDFLRRGLTENVPYVCHIPVPLPNDPSAVEASSGEWLWKLADAFEIDDPENEGVFLVQGGFRCTATMTSGFVFSPTNKTENVMWIGLFRIDGFSNCDYPVHIKGGARIKFIGELRPFNCMQGLRVDCDNFPVDELEIDFLHASHFTGRAAYLEGESGTNPLINSRIGHILTNGAAVDSDTTDFVEIAGVARNLKIDMITSNIDGTLEAPTTAIVHIHNNANGAPSGNCRIGSINNRVGDVTALRTTDTTSAAGSKSNFSVGEVYSAVSTENLIDLAYAAEVHIGKIEPDAAGILIGSDCEDIHLPSVDLWALDDSGVRTRVNGALSRIMTGGTTSLADDGVTTLNLRDTTTRRVGVLNFATTSSNAHGSVAVRVGTSPFLSSLAIGSDVVLTTGALTGTTGTDGKFTVSVSGDLVYFENRTGGALDLVAQML